MHKIAIVAALEREVSGLLAKCRRVEREHQGRRFVFFEQPEEDRVIICGGIGPEAARRAAQAVIDLYRPILIQSVGFAGALTSALRVGDILAPASVIDARDGSRITIPLGSGVLITFMTVVGAEQKANLGQAYQAQAVDMEAAAVAAAASARGIRFSTVKVISDTIDFEMPETARFVDSQGQFHTRKFALHAALRPWLWPRLMQLARNSNKASRILVEHLTAVQPHRTEVSEAKTS